MTAMKVLTYNVHLWEGRDGRIDVERLATIIENSEADVVSLNEVLHPVQTHFGASKPLAELANLLRMDWAFGESNRVVQMSGWWGPVGNAVLSRHPIVDDTNHYLARLPLTQGRNLLMAKIAVNSGRTFTIFSTHLDHAFEGIRLWQLRGALDPLLAYAAEPHLLMGDFNTHGPTGVNSRRLTPPVVRMLRNKGYVDAYMAAGEGEGGTFPMLWPFRIDYIFVPQIIQPSLMSCRVLTGKLIEQASDHRPLMAIFDWN
jgi:endonuclease/exonuclease/phosphatase family metal-dependent hydrolase